MRLRALRRLEEIAIKKELAALADRAEGAEGAARRREAAMEGDRRRDRRAAQGVRARRRSASAAPRSARRPPTIEVPVEALIEREPVTVLCSAKGWIRAVKGHGLALGEIKYKEGDEAALRGRGRDHRQAAALRHQRALLHARRRQAAGRARPWRAAAADDRSRQRRTTSSRCCAYRPGAKLLLAASDGRGFVVPADEVLAQTRNGKQVLMLRRGRAGAGLRPGRGRHGRGGRRQPQAAALPARRGAGDGARPRRHPAALSRRRPRRRQGLHRAPTA